MFMTYDFIRFFHCQNHFIHHIKQHHRITVFFDSLGIAYNIVILLAGDPRLAGSLANNITLYNTATELPAWGKR